MVITAKIRQHQQKQVVGTLTNADTGKVIVNAKVKIEINGELTTVKSNSKGQVTVSTEDLTAGTYTAIISYQGNTKYNPASTVVSVDV